MKTKNYFIIFFLFIGNLSIFSQTKSGLIIAGGTGFLSNLKEGKRLQEILDMGGTKKNQYKFNVAIGYKFRIEPQNRSHFFDIDLYAGLKRFNSEYSYFGQGTTDDGQIIFNQRSGKASGTYYYFAFNPNYNYKIYKNLHLGIGIEPTLYYADGEGKWKFDIPPMLRLGYNFKYFDMAISYKMGLLNVMKSSRNFSSGNLNDIQLQLFIPF